MTRGSHHEMSPRLSRWARCAQCCRQSMSPPAGAVGVGQDVMLGARPTSVDRARAAFGPRRAVRTCEESITARDHHTTTARLEIPGYWAYPPHG
jgi:hypothetical protein